MLILTFEPNRSASLNYIFFPDFSPLCINWYVVFFQQVISLFALPSIRNVNHKLHFPIPEQGWPNPAIWSTSCFADLAMMISKDNFSSQQETTTVMAATTPHFLHLMKFLPDDKPFQFVHLSNLWISRTLSSEPKDWVRFLDFSKIWLQY